MPSGTKRKSRSEEILANESAMIGRLCALSPPSFEAHSRPSLLELLPKALQINCLKFVDIREIGRTASACRGLQDLGLLRLCRISTCACREQSVNGIATTTNPGRWILCLGDGCGMSGCPLSLEYWATCIDCNDRYCYTCAIERNLPDHLQVYMARDWQCADCEQRHPPVRGRSQDH